MEILYSFKTHLQGRGLSKRTVNSYITTMHRFARWLEQVHGEFDAAAITSLDVAITAVVAKQSMLGRKGLQ